jgi:hypothetical protein
MKRFPTIFLLALLALLSPLSLADAPKTPAPKDDAAIQKASLEMAQAAQKLLDSLSNEQKTSLGFEFTDNERLNWHFIPKPRKGLALKDMSEEQRALAKAMLASGLSQKGNTRVLTIMSLEQILHDIEQGKGPKRDMEMYYWSLFGAPGVKDGAKPWGWRVEGHHLSLNFTIANEKAIAAGPLFLGTNPAEVKEGPKKGLRILAEEEDQARTFVKTLNPDQFKKALIAQTAPKDIITEAKRQAVLEKFQGIPYGDLTNEQKTALMDLVALYATRLRSELAQDDIRRIAHAGLDKIHFAWAGSVEKGEGHYYRIHGPTFLVEYDNVQNNANHIHSVWRDLENDFGGDLLKKHYEESHQNK